MGSTLVMTESSQTTPKSSTMQQADFLLLCGLVLQDSRDRKVSERMEEEVSAAAERLLKTIAESDLAGSSPADRDPTRFVMETAMEAEIQRTFELASSETKAIYSMYGGDDGGNWMIRWMLWGKLTKAAQ